MNNANNTRPRLSLTDEMAVARTKLTNKRTFLAYMRTFIGTLAARVGFIKFTEDLFFVCTGFVLVAISPFVLVFGLRRFIQMKRVTTLFASDYDKNKPM